MRLLSHYYKSSFIILRKHQYIVVLYFVSKLKIPADINNKLGPSKSLISNIYVPSDTSKNL
jgi:hypothetical protein